jgi:TatD DNase family protein
MQDPDLSKAMSDSNVINRVRLVDSHCHLFGDYFKDLDLVLERAVKSGISLALVPGYDLHTSIEAIKLSNTHNWILSAAGIHPTSKFDQASKAIEELDTLITNSIEHISAIGETGIDLYHSTDRVEEQIELFSGHLKLSRKFDKPVIIHSRNSAKVVVDTLKKCQLDLRGIFHCYDGSEALLGYARESGFGVSFAGNVTYANAAQLRDMIAVTPDELVLIETDSPFLAPKPQRGSRNEPAFIIHTLRSVAEVKGWSVEHAAEVVRANFIRIMRIKE